MASIASQLPIAPAALPRRATIQEDAPDPWLQWVMLAAIFISVVSFAFFFFQGTTLYYYDAGARMLITRRVIDSPTPGFAQLGAVWPPFTHLLALPFIMIDPLYRNGMAGSLVSMICFVVSVFYLYKFIKQLTGSRWSALGGLAVFVLNTNILYLQSTGMTEVPMIAAAIGAMYYLLRLTQEPDKRRWYLWSGLFLSAGCLIRYENWVLLAAAGAMLAFSFLRRRFAWSRIEGSLIYWGYWAGIGALAWIAWNLLIFGDPLYFQRGEYADASLWVTASDAIGNGWIAFLTYFYATMNTVGPLLVVGAAGGLVYLLRTRLRAESVIPYLPLVLFPFFVFMIYGGQRPLQVFELGATTLYNVRFGLVMILPTAVFIGYLAAQHRLMKAVVPIVVLVGGLAGLVRYDTITLQEASSFVTGENAKTQVAAGGWLLENYDNRPMLMESFGNDIMQYSSGIPLRNIIYEGSYRMWEEALKNPQDWAEWVVMRDQAGDLSIDKVWEAHHDNPTFHEFFELAYQNASITIYHRREPLPFDRIAGETS
jgi:4-amino-4-deoxy-L-arabinose transferase-like glycosyltransferase